MPAVPTGTAGIAISTTGAQPTENPQDPRNFTVLVGLAAHDPRNFTVLVGLAAHDPRNFTEVALKTGPRYDDFREVGWILTNRDHGGNCTIVAPL
jgi:hypothetical protein